MHTGKTTLLNVLAGQVPASPNLALTGRLFVNGRSVGQRNGGGGEHSQVKFEGLNCLLWVTDHSVFCGLRA